MCIQISRRDYLSLIVFTKQTFIIIQGSVQFTESRETLIMPFLETPAKCFDVTLHLLTLWTDDAILSLQDVFEDKLLYS